jgi:hypothetical protein
MPPKAVANWNWGGREHPLYRDLTLYSRPTRGTLSEGTASACMRQVVACAVCAQSKRTTSTSSTALLQSGDEGEGIPRRTSALLKVRAPSCSALSVGCRGTHRRGEGGGSVHRPFAWVDCRRLQRADASEHCFTGAVSLPLEALAPLPTRCCRACD